MHRLTKQMSQERRPQKCAMPWWWYRMYGIEQMFWSPETSANQSSIFLEFLYRKLETAKEAEWFGRVLRVLWFGCLFKRGMLLKFGYSRHLYWTADRCFRLSRVNDCKLITSARSTTKMEKIKTIFIAIGLSVPLSRVLRNSEMRTILIN